MYQFNLEKHKKLGRLRADFANNDPADPDDDAVTEYRYDRASRLLAEIQNGRAVQSQYDPAGNRTDLQYPGGKTLSYRYDRLNRLEEIKDNGTFLAGWQYSARGLVEEKRLGNGARTTYEHNARDWTTKKEATSFHARVTSFEHTYDNEGNKLTAEDKVLPELSKKYAYDKIYRLTDWKRRGRSGGRLREEQSWDLDLLGNWLETAYDSTTEKRKHNEVNEPTGIKKNDSERTLTYNPAGNLTDDDNQIYIYNYRNLLTEIRDKAGGTTVAEYTYDASSRRRTKKLPGPANSPPSTITFIYDGWKVLEERDGDGNILAEYTHGLYIDEYVTIETGGKRAYYHQDTIYNVKALTDKKGKLIERYAYTAYGEPSVLNKNGMPVPRSKVGNRYLFQGRRYDQESGLYYFRHRMMSGELGRFLQRDAEGYTDSLNLFVFVGNNPLVRLA
ncbi:MAG: RHS repeat domain-containing protein [Candidatus Brocadiia bacterium]